MPVITNIIIPFIPIKYKTLYKDIKRNPSSYNISDLLDFMETHHEIGALLTLAREA